MIDTLYIASVDEINNNQKVVVERKNYCLRAEWYDSLKGCGKV